MKEGGGVGEGEETWEGEGEWERRERACGCEELKKRMGESDLLKECECECEWREGSARSASGRRLVWEKLRSKTRSTLFLTRVLVVRRGVEGPPMGRRGSLLCFMDLRGTSWS